MTTTILVTGATGTVGSGVVRELGKNAAVRQRVAVRDPAKAKDLPANATAVDFDWNDEAKIAAAVAGVDAVFLLTPFDPSQVTAAKRLVDAAVAAGVKKIVKLSAAGVESEAFEIAKWHRAAERLVEGSGLKWVVLRPNFFMSNFIGYYPPDAEGAIYLPTADGKAAWIDTRDIAEVAAAALVRSDWDGRALDLTGPEALSIGDVAKHLSAVTGRTIRHVDVPEAAARSSMEGMQMPGWMVQAMMDLNTILKNGWPAATTSLVQDITGHAPRSFAAFAKENAAAWAKR